MYACMYKRKDAVAAETGVKSVVPVEMKLSKPRSSFIRHSILVTLPQVRTEKFESINPCPCSQRSSYGSKSFLSLLYCSTRLTYSPYAWHVHPQAEILEEDLSVKEVLSEGSHFGTKSLVYNTPMQWSVVAVTHVDVFSVNQRDFERVLLDHPNSRDSIAELA